MSLNEFIASLALKEIERHNTNLYDAIVELDKGSINYLVNHKYKMEVIQANCIRESMNINQMLAYIESKLNNKTHVLA